MTRAAEAAARKADLCIESTRAFTDLCACGQEIIAAVLADDWAAARALVGDYERLRKRHVAAAARVRR